MRNSKIKSINLHIHLHEFWDVNVYVGEKYKRIFIHLDLWIEIIENQIKKNEPYTSKDIWNLLYEFSKDIQIDFGIYNKIHDQQKRKKGIYIEILCCISKKRLQPK
ncbi:hypothetical protein PNEG_03604 [Pneumocystis murina B123]|uniref:Uncharacterized protein n=1 Tax=Pneumocystis murina (strain B123) TaxID=1069680 RepID=M7NQ90_PNEMU|nr:hypothetical protein PNEG_03604 [Pneumocystis murina B123]EMR10878.1 hypothetical protein PNEG_03604 [Pneumocystis murina B123]